MPRSGLLRDAVVSVTVSRAVSVSPGRTGLSLVRVEKANGAEAGRVWLSGKPADYEVDPGTGTAYVQTGNREIIAARFP